MTIVRKRAGAHSIGIKIGTNKRIPTPHQKTKSRSALHTEARSMDPALNLARLASRMCSAGVQPKTSKKVNDVSPRFMSERTLSSLKVLRGCIMLM